MYIPSFREMKSNIIRAYQRAIRGYDYSIRNGWGVEKYFTQIIPEIKIFCERQLEDVEHMPFNYRRGQIYRRTLRLIEDYEKMTDKEEVLEDNQLNKLLIYIGKHYGWYWN